jgi:hypothetical protein
MRSARYVMTLLTVTTTLVTAGEAFAGDETDIRIVVHVDNYSRILRPDRSAAEEVATQIYAKAGVRIVWASGDDEASAPGLHVRMQLLSSDMAMRKIKAEGLADTVLGLSAREAGRAYIFTHRIFTHRIARRTLRPSGDFRRLLGLVMAHELGHLVLPSHSHSGDGIMRANIGVLSNSALAFTTEQGAAIRSMLVSGSHPNKNAALKSAALAVPCEDEGLR